MGNVATVGMPVSCLQHLRPRRQQGRIAAELVEHEAMDQLAFRLVQQRPGAVEMSEGAATVDVGDEQAARIRMLRHAHVDDVAG